MQFLLCRPRKNLQFQFVKISGGKRNYCEKQGNSKELKKNDEIVPLKAEAPNRLKEMANSIGRQLAILSPANSRTGRILWILVGVILILALWNRDKIRGFCLFSTFKLLFFTFSLLIHTENRKKNKIVSYERMFFQKDYQKLIDRTTESIESNNYVEDHYYRGNLIFSAFFKFVIPNLFILYC
jgi:hypothetical protein